ncbi:DUF2917 family protein [Azonexus fungiphilus]|uniref:DUF2917 family protein n=1 Tax=Azonexus fungiphilus TaxID=146940 RepID=A0A495WEA9_9RHOO|nr:DUF2917 domain-containing protein [Azonexus fungiphilus]RKT58128.1 DUF2917 family protein [Azonexus fungiphilus]
MTEHPNLSGSLFCRLQLSSEQLVRLSPRRVAALSVDDGRAWITRPGETTDLILGPGQHLCLAADGAPLLVSGFDSGRPAALCVEFRARAADWRLRLARRLLAPGGTLSGAWQ